MADDAPDRMSWLIGQLGSNDPDPAVARELPVAVHVAIYPMCLNLLGSADAAYDAEQETWRRLLEYVARRDASQPSITNGVAYVRQIARNVCHDMRRREGRHDMAIDEVAERHFSTGEPAWAEATVAPGSPQGGYRSRRVLRDLAGLSDQERAVLGLRQTGRSYREIAQTLGGGLTMATAQTQGERAMLHLRGRVHVEVWSQEPPDRWPVPACPDLARLKAETQRRLLAGAPVTTTLYREIGKHLDPQPKRSKGTLDNPACQLCHPERKRSELAYWWLIATIPPVLAGWQLASPPSAAAAVAVDSPGRGKRRRPRSRVRTVSLISAAAVVVVAVAVIAVVLIPHLGAQDESHPQAGPSGGPGGATAAAFARPDPCTLLTQDEVTQVNGHPVRACVTTGLQPDRGPVAVKDAAVGTFTSSSDEFPQPVSVEADDLGADPPAAFAQACQLIQQVAKGFDPNPTTGAIPGLGDENCYATWSVGSESIVSLAARRKNIAVTVTLSRNQPPADLVKLALSRIH